MRKIIRAAAMLSSLFQMSLMAQNLGTTSPPGGGIKVVNPVPQHNVYVPTSPALDIATPTEPSPPTPSLCSIQYLNINVHFMLNNDGSGNFNQLNDGLGNVQANGYRYADTLIDMVNTSTAYAYNPPLAFYPANMPQPANPAVRIKLILKGVYYHRNSTFNNFTVFGLDHQYPILPAGIAAFSVKNDKEINLFITNPAIIVPYQFTPMNPPFIDSTYSESNTIYGGINNARLAIGSPWRIHYKKSILAGISRSVALANAARPYKDLIVNKIGQLLNLTNPEYDNDECDDTPPDNRCRTDNYVNQPGMWYECTGGVQLSNNVMDRTESREAFSPCQIDRMHAALYGNMAPFVNSCISSTGFNSCPPVSSFFDFPIQIDVCRPGAIPEPIVWGQASYGESGYVISINRTDAMGSNIELPGSTQTRSFTGEASRINLNTIFNLSVAGFYRIGLSVTNNCGKTDISYRWSYIRRFPTVCPVNPPLPQPPPPTRPDKLIIYPNPSLSAGSLSLSSPDGMFGPNEKVSICIGRPERSSKNLYEFIADEKGILDLSISLKSYTTGVYFVSATSASGHTTHQKLVIY